MTSLQFVKKVNMFKEIKIVFDGDKVNDAGGTSEGMDSLSHEGIIQPTNRDFLAGGH